MKATTCRSMLLQNINLALLNLHIFRIFFFQNFSRGLSQRNNHFKCIKKQGFLATKSEKSSQKQHFSVLTLTLSYKNTSKLYGILESYD